MKADIVACFGNSIIDWAISKITGSKVTHVAIMYDNEDELVLEAIWSGNQVIDIDSKKGKYYILRYEGLTPEQRDEVVDYIKPTLDADYDYRLIFAILIYRLFGRLVYIDDSTKFICSEIIVDAYKSVGIDIVPQLGEKKYASPGDLYNSPVFKLIK
jgi:hypothetical protein